jgi:hypothetical protein
MDERTEAKFEQIAADAIVRAESVDCGVEDFVEGMRSIFISIKERYDMACEEHGIEPIYPR